MNWVHSLYQKRFPIFMISLCTILFGNLIFPQEIFHLIISPIFLLINVLTGILLVKEKKRSRIVFIGLLIAIVLTFGIEFKTAGIEQISTNIRFGLLFMFYALITLEVISQVWLANQVNETVILGVITGYICLGLLGFFLFMSIEILEPGSFYGISEGIESGSARESMLYFSFITLLTIGYGDIVPNSYLAMKASVLLGLLGQFYMVILTAIVVGKFLGSKYRQ